VAFALAAVAALAGLSVDVGRSEADHAAGMDAMSIDTNIAGNTASANWTWNPPPPLPLPTPPVGHTETLGPNDACMSADPGNTITVDVTALNIPADKPITAFGFNINYDMDAFTITESTANFILGGIAGSSVVNVSEPGPDSDGEFTAAALDIDVTKAEYGSGVLIRLAVDVNPGANPGIYPLTLTSAGHGDPVNHWYVPATIIDATVAISQPCPTVFGDVDCSGTVNSVDALKVLRFNAGLSVSQTDPCVDMAQTLPNTELQGDVDCSNTVNAVDALKLLRFGAGLPVTQNDPCPDINT
jgi:hypothetical protein